MTDVSDLEAQLALDDLENPSDLNHGLNDRESGKRTSADGEQSSFSLPSTSNMLHSLPYACCSFSTGSVSTSPLTWDDTRDSLASNYEQRVQIVKLCDDVVWGQLVWEEDGAPAMDALACFVCCPCMVPTTNDPQTQDGKLAPGKVAWQRLCTCAVLFSLLEAIVLIVDCAMPPGIAPIEV